MTDALIIGGGLAGIHVALALQSKGWDIILIDDPKQPAASAVAGGMFNPVTGKHLAKTWMAEELFPFLKSHYTRLEKEWETHFYHEIPVYRPFANENQKKQFLQALDKHDLRGFAQNVIAFENYKNNLHQDLGGILIEHSGWLDVPLFIRTAKSHLAGQNALRDMEFQYSKLKIDTTFKYEELEARHLIFCEGYYLKNNPWFSSIPLNPVKGETLKVKYNSDLQHIINQNGWLIPLTDNKARLGATYSWHKLDFTPTPEAKAFLLEKLNKFYKGNVTVEDQQAGVRPATKDRRPILGEHPKITGMYLFNGLGTKGVSIAPYWANKFSEFVVDKKELSPEVTLNRFYTLS